MENYSVASRAYIRHIVLILLVVAGCSSRLYPTSTGFHASGKPLAVGGLRQTYVIWSTDAGISTHLTGLLLRSGHTVVERSHVGQIFAEQQFRLMYTPDREADVLHIGAMAGATQVIFVNAESSRDRKQSVSLRSVEVESGTVR